MRWRNETLEECFQRCRKWHKFFAWLPVTQDGTTFWLTSIERRWAPSIGAFSRYEGYWEYRDPSVSKEDE